MKKVLKIVFLIVGLILTFLPVLLGLYSSIAGVCSGVFPCDEIYGYEAFSQSFVLLSALLWPVMIIGLLLSIAMIILLIKGKKKAGK